jgi:ABC-type antimicrobial peptide transport system permease subunit
VRKDDWTCPKSSFRATATEKKSRIRRGRGVDARARHWSDNGNLYRSVRDSARADAVSASRQLLLATLGLYGVTAYTVARRTSEIGIRMALGAERMAVTAMVMRGATIQAAIGLAIGIPTALLSVRFVESQLYEIKGVDAGVLAASISVLLISVSVAGLIPARRAAKVDPMVALRYE